MTHFFTADNHFFHKNIIAHCNRPFADLEEMHETMIERWNKAVTCEDIVFIVGDFSFGSYSKTREILERLNGKKMLVVGNHDSKKNFDLFEGVWTSLDVARDECHFTVAHYPYKLASEDKSSIRENDLPKNAHMKYTENQGKWLIHGHVHKGWKVLPSEKMINVGVDMWDFTLVHVDVIRDIILRDGKTNDHR